MNPPSPSEYLPLDLDISAAFAGSRIGNNIWLAAAILVLYDHAITLEIEVERIWTLNWGLPKILFFISRYAITPMLMILLATNISHPASSSFCVFYSRSYSCIQALSLIVIELILLIRVTALYGHSKIITCFLMCLFTCQVAAAITIILVSELETTPVFYSLLPDCWSNADRKSALILNSLWIPFLCGDGIVLILTLAKAFSYRDHFNPTIRLLARDSVLYFIPMFAILVWNLISTTSISGLPKIPAEWIACIAVSRMMLSIRSLAFNDPLSTQRLRFSTMVFENRDRGEDAGNPGGADVTVEQPTGGV